MCFIEVFTRQLITSRVSSRGNRIGPVFVCPSFRALTADRTRFMGLPWCVGPLGQKVNLSHY